MMGKAPNIKVLLNTKKRVGRGAGDRTRERERGLDLPRNKASHTQSLYISALLQDARNHEELPDLSRQGCSSGVGPNNDWIDEAGNVPWASRMKS